jgi:nucleotide-binding universal stress UspA family protein
MASGSSGRAGRADGADPFPWVVSLGCLGALALLFLHSTMPALAEHRELELREEQFRSELDESEARIRSLRRATRQVGQDPETLLVEFDRLGMTPQQAIDEVARELDAESVEPIPAPDAAESPDANGRTPTPDRDRQPGGPR